MVATNLSHILRRIASELSVSIQRASAVHSSALLRCENVQENEVEEAKGFAFNNIMKKKGLCKPVHVIEEQIEYVRSKAFEYAYNGLPIYMSYRRNVRGQLSRQPPPRLVCLDNERRYKTNNPCPICRDEYLFFDFRNPVIIEMFIYKGTETPVPLLKSGLCKEQYMLLKVELLKAREHGTIKLSVPFRNYDYSAWYPWWKGEEMQEVKRGNQELSVYDIHPDPLVSFPIHKSDLKNDWDEWWKRYDKFAQKSK